jgi:hypothetical protein
MPLAARRTSFRPASISGIIDFAVYSPIKVLEVRTGKCNLCLDEKDLVSSHLIPRGVYDYCKPPGSDPVILTKELVIQSSRQIQDYVLCGECENFLNKRGESWVLPLLARMDGAFPFHDILHEQAADIAEPDFQVYSSSKNPNIDVSKLANFALGIFWKASVHSWRGGRLEPQIELGRYGEPLRLYLRSQGPFPKEMMLSVCVLPQPVRFIAANIPYRGSAEGFHNFLFHVPGLYFALRVGKGVPPEIKGGCFVANSGHPIIEAEFEKALVNVAREATANAHVHKKVLAY